MKKNVFVIAFMLPVMLLFLTGFAQPAESQSSFKLPEYTKFVMKNGLTVYLMEQHEVPLIYATCVFPAGAVKDGNRYGLASLTADGLLFGTKNYSKKQIEETLDYIGASFSTFAAKEYSQLDLSFVAKDQDTVFPIMQEIITAPVFDRDEFDKRKTRMLMELQQAKERPQSVIRSYFDKFIYADNAYGNPAEGTNSSVTAIQVQDLQNFYNQHYTPAGSALVLVGDLDSKAMKEKIEKMFHNWTAKSQPIPAQQVRMPVLTRSRVLLVNKDDATETRFLIGGYGIKRSNPDYVAIQVINTILGDRFTSWLNDELRVKRGLTYGARSFFRPYKTTGLFAISSYTGNETTFEALDVALEVLNRLHTQGVDEATLSSARNYIKGQFPPQYETSGSLAELLASMFIYDFDEAFINDFQANVDKLTVEKSQEIITKYFPKENLQFVLIGKASELRDKVSKYGSVTEKEIKADGY
ncbi:MAG TPA: pitrilysin family protein [bacterium]|nr:pitrilysin family protein [bacterium]HPN43466.1 pitrilysin family protein [bacterium]